jgi:hypothetical protein
MNRTTATLIIGSIILGAVMATALGWRYGVEVRHNSAGWRWRSAATVAALALVTLSLILLAAYATRNAITGGDGNGDWTTLIFIRTGNYLSLASVLAGCIGKGKARWPTLVGGCLMEFLWFSEGMSL